MKLLHSAPNALPEPTGIWTRRPSVIKAHFVDDYGSSINFAPIALSANVVTRFLLRALLVPPATWSCIPLHMSFLNDLKEVGWGAKLL